MYDPLENPLTASRASSHPLDIKLARSRDELHQAFALTYHSYFRAGLVVDNPSGLRLTPYHLLPDSEVIVAKLDETVVSTLSWFGDGKLGLPMQSMYSNEISFLRDQGCKLAEIGSLADRRSDPRRFISSFADMCRLLAQAAASRNIDTLLAVAHPKHAKLYKRVLGFKQIGDHTDCPYANGNPAEALFLRFEDLSDKLYERFFGDPLSLDLLVPYDWDIETRINFGRILDCDGKIAHAIGLADYYDWNAKRIKTPINLFNNLGSTNIDTVSQITATATATN
jgi:hypothetical protein